MDMQSLKEWFTEHKLRAVGTLWATSLLGSFAYNFAQPGMKTSVKLIHARLHAQALTLAALAGSALVEAHDHHSGLSIEMFDRQSSRVRIGQDFAIHSFSNSAKYISGRYFQVKSGN